jgi:hypothetical protein
MQTSRYNEEIDKNDYNKLIDKKLMYKKKIYNLNNKKTNLNVISITLHKNYNDIANEIKKQFNVYKKVLKEVRSDIRQRKINIIKKKIDELKINKDEIIKLKKINNEKISKHNDRINKYLKIIKSINNNLSKFNQENKRDTSVLPMTRRLNSQLTNLFGKNYLKDLKSNSSISKSKSNTLDEMNMNNFTKKDEEKILRELNRLEKNDKISSSNNSSNSSSNYNEEDKKLLRELEELNDIEMSTNPLNKKGGNKKRKYKKKY